MENRKDNLHNAIEDKYIFNFYFPGIREYAKD